MELLEPDQVQRTTGAGRNAAVADAQGPVHALCGSRMPARLSRRRRDRSVANGIVDFQQENCIGCGYCVSGCPFNIPKFNPDDEEGLQVHAVLRSGGRGPGTGLHQVLPDGLPAFRDQRGHAATGRNPGEAAPRALRFPNAGVYDPESVGGHTRSTCCTTSSSRNCTAASPPTRRNQRDVHGMEAFRRASRTPVQRSSPHRWRSFTTSLKDRSSLNPRRLDARNANEVRGRRFDE